MSRRAKPVPSPAGPGLPVFPDAGPIIEKSPGTAAIPRLLWGWPEVVTATNNPRRTLEREMAGGRFPKPVKRIGRRPFWLPSDIVAWAEGK